MTYGNLSDVKTALATALDAITGLRGYAYIPDSFVPPAAFIFGPERIIFDESFGGPTRGLHTAIFNLVVIAARVEDRQSQKTLDQFLAVSGDASVKEQIQNNPTLTGTVDSVRVTELSQVAPVQIENDPKRYLAAQFEIECLIRGT